MTQLMVHKQYSAVILLTITALSIYSIWSSPLSWLLAPPLNMFILETFRYLSSAPPIEWVLTGSAFFIQLLVSVRQILAANAKAEVWTCNGASQRVTTKLRQMAWFRAITCLFYAPVFVDTIVRCFIDFCLRAH